MQTGQTQRAFGLVCQNLARLGAISLTDFLKAASREDNSEESPEHASRLTDTVTDETIPEESDLHVGTIERACRSAGASLYWTTYSQDNGTHPGASDHTSVNPSSILLAYLAWGAALKIRPSVNDRYTYSTDALHHDPPSAKAACAQFAIEQGILDHIKVSNDEHIVPSLDDPGTTPSATKYSSLKDFYTELSGPRPLPVPVNPLSRDFDFKAFLNTLMSEAKGARLSQKWFYWVGNHSRKYQLIPSRDVRLMVKIDSSRLHPTARKPHRVQILSS